MGHYHDEITSNAASTKELMERLPDTYAAFRDIHRAAFTDPCRLPSKR
ncbi:MAG: hypothetical protein QGD91_00050 [Actinomycetota bacterium]|nr:hypothetical protein [Actinomycetota bacterium]MDK1096207.1 hypothetical protein [Actinomycetota bacterium]MDK1103891.1 hypothetical protein [Actinomycetota bacterium]